MTITIVVALDNNGGIGKDGGLPWHVPAELAHFHRTVADMTTVCGVNTYPTLPKALRERTLVWSGRGWGGVPASYNTDQILSLAAMRDIAIIGGAKTYAEFLPYADKIVMSRIHGTFEADTFFRPNFQGWHGKQQKTVTCAHSKHIFTVWEYTRLVQP